MSKDPASSPPQEESGQFPFSSVVSPEKPEYVGPNFPGAFPVPINPPGPSAFAACTIAPDFPDVFGSGKIPIVSPEP